MSKKHNPSGDTVLLKAQLTDSQGRQTQEKLTRAALKVIYQEEQDGPVWLCASTVARRRSHSFAIYFMTSACRRLLNLPICSLASKRGFLEKRDIIN